LATGLGLQWPDYLLLLPGDLVAHCQSVLKFILLII
jgi:hypothetical protein